MEDDKITNAIKYLEQLGCNEFKIGHRGRINKLCAQEISYTHKTLPIEVVIRIKNDIVNEE